MDSGSRISQLKVLWGMSSVPVPSSQLPVGEWRLVPALEHPWGFPCSLAGCCIRTVVASVMFLSPVLGWVHVENQELYLHMSFLSMRHLE